MELLDDLSKSALVGGDKPIANNVAAVWQLERVTDEWTDEAVAAHIGARFAGSPITSRVLRAAPLLLRNPSWVDAGGSNPSDHVSFTSPPGADNWRQALQDAAKFVQEPLDRSKPLWAVRLYRTVTGFEEEPRTRSLLVIKVHHGATDGLAAVAFQNRLTDTGPLDPRSAPRAATPPARPAETVPGGALRTLAQLPADLLAAGRSIGGLARLYREAAAAAKKHRSAGSPQPVGQERVAFNGSIGETSTFRSIPFPFEDARALRGLAPGATINDVALAVIAGALRAHVEAAGEASVPNLTCLIPLSLHQGRVEEGSNQTARAVVALHTDTADPLERLRRIHESTAKAKAARRDGIGVRLEQAAMALPPLLLEAGAPLANKRLATATRIPCNTFATNVPRSPVPLFFLGSRILLAVGCPPLSPSIGLSFGVSSYAGQLTITFHCFTHQVPDPDAFAARVRAAKAELDGLLGSAAPQP